VVRRLTDRELCQKALEVLRERLGPVDALRFLSLTRTPNRDYQRWRDEHFRDLRVDELLKQLAEMQP